MFRPRARRASKPPTDAQSKAHARNFTIFRLRGLYYHAWLLTDARRDQMRALVDAELAALGSETQTTRIERASAECEAIRRRWAIIDKLEKGIPIP